MRVFVSNETQKMDYILIEQNELINQNFQYQTKTGSALHYGSWKKSCIYSKESMSNFKITVQSCFVNIFYNDNYDFVGILLYEYLY